MNRRGLLIIAYVNSSKTLENNDKLSTKNELVLSKYFCQFFLFTLIELIILKAWYQCY